MTAVQKMKPKLIINCMTNPDLRNIPRWAVSFLF